MKSSTVLCLVLSTIIFATSVKFSEGFPSAAPEKIRNDLKTFEGRSSPTVHQSSTVVSQPFVFFLQHFITNFPE